MYNQYISQLQSNKFEVPAKSTLYIFFAHGNIFILNKPDYILIFLKFFVIPLQSS